MASGGEEFEGVVVEENKSETDNGDSTTGVGATEDGAQEEEEKVAEEQALIRTRRTIGVWRKLVEWLVSARALLSRLVGWRREYVVLWDYEKQRPDEIGVLAGTVVYLEKEAISPGFRWRWALVSEKETGIEGFLPRSYLALKTAYDRHPIFSAMWYVGEKDVLEMEAELKDERFRVGSFAISAYPDGLQEKAVYEDVSYDKFALTVKQAGKMPGDFDIVGYTVERDPHGRYYVNKGEYTPNLYTLLLRLKQCPGKLGFNTKLLVTRRLEEGGAPIPPPPIPVRIGRLEGLGTRAAPLAKMLNMEEVNKMDKDELARYLEPYGLKREDLILGAKLGEGQFGTVMKATWVRVNARDEEVAVKQLKLELGATSWMEFEKEAVIMAQLSHPNIVRFYGFCREKEPYLIVTEFVNRGSLDNYLIEYEEKAGHPLPNPTRLSVMFQVARGMAYVEGRGLVHRDLAARNCLVSKAIKETVLVKIADFGLSVAGSKKRKKNAGGDGDNDTIAGSKGDKDKYPWKWMSIEALEFRQYSTKSDVWAFGIFMLEVYGVKDFYFGVGNDEMLEHLKGGERPEKPEEMAEEQYEVCNKCWLAVPAERPSFKELVKVLEKLKEKEGQEVYARMRTSTASSGNDTDIELLPSTSGSEDEDESDEEEFENV